MAADWGGCNTMTTLAELLKEGKKHISEVAGTLAGNERIKERSKGYAATLKNTLLNNYPMLSKDPQNVTVADILGSGLGAMPLAIKAFHGSPHKFDAFDMSKIGTGEGAQVYGHGLYFAEDPAVAAYYKDALGTRDRDTVSNAIDRIVHLHNKDKSRIRDALITEGFDSNKITPDIERTISNIIDGTNIDGTVTNLALNEYKKLESFIPKTGQMYETSLQWPDPAREAADPLSPGHFLDWDADIGSQPESVRKFWDKFLSSKAGKSADRSMRGDLFNKQGQYANPSGKDIHGALTEGLIGYGKPRPFLEVKDEAAQKLRKAGIPGIRYLDQGSRGAGDGTYNYVIFDDQIPKIVKRNGVVLRDILK